MAIPDHTPVRLRTPIPFNCCPIAVQLLIIAVHQKINVVVERKFSQMYRKLKGKNFTIIHG